MKNILSVLLLITQVFIHQSVRAQIPSYVPTNGLIGWWPFNGNANDESGNGNNGTVNGAALKTDRFGNFGKAYSFDGVNDYIEMKNNLLLNPPIISISGWINSSADAVDVQSGAKSIVSKWYQQINCNNSGDNYTIQLSFLNNTSVLLGCTSKNNTVSVSLNTSTNLIGINNWKHFVFIHSGIYQKLYINGQLIGTKNVNGNLCPTSNNLLFGADNKLGNFWRFYKGIIDDIGIWNRALTEQEIIALYESNPYTLNLKLFLQGYYQNPGSSNPMDNNGNGGCLFVTGKSINPADVDTVKVTLINTALKEVASVNGILKTNGSLVVSFAANSGLVPGNQYYLKINHHNSLETWSASPITFNAMTTYDLTTSSNKAYGNNLVEVSPGVWAIFSGDIADASLGPEKQDGVIETSDYSEMENAAYQVLTGYKVQDITGDGVVETSDYSLMENNASLVLSAKRPK